jgi:hypothetical protein
MLGGNLMVVTGVLSIEETYSRGRFQYSENAGSTKYPLAVTELLGAIREVVPGLTKRAGVFYGGSRAMRTL